MRKRLIIALALVACGKHSMTPLDTPTPVVVAKTASFTCGPKPTCPPGHPTDDRALVDAIQAGRADLVACLGDKLRVETDPGFTTVVPTPDGKYLLGRVENDNLVRVFDAKTWTETMRLDDAVTSFGALGARAVVNHRAGGATLWDLAARTSTTLPTTAGVSTEGSAVFWLDGRALAIAAVGKDVVRVPIDAPKEPLALAELPGGKYLASTPTGRDWVIDPATAAVVRSFRAPESRPFRVAQDALLLDVGSFIDGTDMAYFAPTHAPVVVALAGHGQPQPLTGRACTASVLVAVSDDGANAVTRAGDAWCLFDVPTRKLLGAVKDSAFVNPDGDRFVTRGRFVSPNVVVVSVGTSSTRLRVQLGRPDPLYDLTPVNGTLLASTSPDSLAPPPVDRAWVGFYESGAPPTRALYEVRADGTILTTNPPLDLQSTAEPQLDPRGERVIAPDGVRSVRSCLLSTAAACVDLPIGGAYVTSPDGTWAAGPSVVGSAGWTAPPFVDRAGALTVASVATGKPLLVQHAAGVAAAAFTTETDLALFGEDGALLTCSLTARTCRREATNAKADAITSERGHLVIADDASVTSVPPLATAPPPAMLSRATPYIHVLDREKLFLVGRGAIIEPYRSGLVVKDARGNTLRTLSFAGRGVLAASTAPARLAALSSEELAVWDVDTGNKLLTRKLRESDFTFAGAVAIDAAGTRVAFADGNDLRVFDVETGQERGHWPLHGSTALAISPDGTRLASAVQIEKTPKSTEEILVLMDVDAAKSRPERVTLGPSRARLGNGFEEIALTNGGHVVVVYDDGGARLVDPARRVFELAREDVDDGVWLKNAAGVSHFGTLAPTSRGIDCRVGSWMLPTDACLPVVCSD